VAFFDFDNDGNQDLLFINSAFGRITYPQGKNKPTMALYRNDGKARITDVTQGSGLDVDFYGMGVAVGDYDNDGLPDLFITAVGGNQLVSQSRQGKIRANQRCRSDCSPEDWSTSAAWIDYDNDGKLDLFVCKLCPLVARNRSIENL
jgi:hypothetical protein